MSVSASRDRVGPLADRDQRRPGVDPGPERDQIVGRDGHRHGLPLAVEGRRRPVTGDLSDLGADASLDDAGTTLVFEGERKNGVVGASHAS